MLNMLQVDYRLQNTFLYRVLSNIYLLDQRFQLLKYTSEYPSAVNNVDFIYQSNAFKGKIYSFIWRTYC